MQPMSWKCLALIAIAMCSLAMAVPVPQDLSDAPNPLADDVSKWRYLDVKFSIESDKIWCDFGSKQSHCGWHFPMMPLPSEGCHYS